MQATSAGSQVFNNYGPKSNEEFLLGYGFVIDPNPDDTVILRLGSNIPSILESRMRAKCLNARNRFALRKDGEVDAELLEVMRVMMAPAEAEGHAEDERTQHEKEIWEIQSEMEVLGTLGQMMEDKLVKLQYEHRVDSRYVREENRRNCEIYRRGES